jgi:formamidopyrimidine-DNA glycosylase
MSGQLVVQPASAPAEAHLRVTLSFVDGDPQLRFIDQRTFGGLALEPLVPAGATMAVARHEIRPGDAGQGGADVRRAAAGEAAVRRGTPGHIDPPSRDRCGVPEAEETVPASVAHIARDPLDPCYDLEETATRLRHRRTVIKRALLDQTLVSGIGNIYADESLWRVGLHGERPTDRLTRRQAREVLSAAAEVMRESLDQGGTSFDALYVNVNGQGGYFERSLAAYGRAGEPCDRCGTPIVRQAFMNRSSFSCPHCQPPPRARRAPRGG